MTWLMRMLGLALLLTVALTGCDKPGTRNTFNFAGPVICSNIILPNGQQTSITAQSGSTINTTSGDFVVNADCSVRPVAVVPPVVVGPPA